MPHSHQVWMRATSTGILHIAASEPMNEHQQIPADTAFNAIGQPVRRKEDQRLLTGKGRFTDDFNIDGPGLCGDGALAAPACAHRARSTPRRRRRCRACSACSPARTASPTGSQPIPHSPVPSTKFDMKLTAPGGGTVFIGPHLLLPADKVRHVGEAVAMVVAETRAQALDAAEAVEVEYEELPFVVCTPRTRSNPARRRCGTKCRTTCSSTRMFGDEDATDRAFAQADHVVKMEFNIGRVTARADGAARRARPLRRRRPAATRSMPAAAARCGRRASWPPCSASRPTSVRVLSYDVGGNFGARNRPYVEFGLVLWAARKLGRPVKYTATRSEAFLTDYQGRDLVTKVELALRKDGRVPGHARRQHQQCRRALRVAVAARKGSGLITGPYDIPAASLRSRAVFTNTMPTNAYRSSGRPEVTYAIERLIDMAADAARHRPGRLRRKNLVQPKAMPYRNAVGMPYDSGTYEANMDLAMRHRRLGRLQAAQARGEEARQAARAWARELRRILDRRAARAHRDHGEAQRPGRRRDRHAAERPGPRDELRAGGRRPARGAGRAAINIIIGDTDIVSVGGGSHSGRSMRHAGDGDRQGRARADRQGQADRRAACSNAPDGQGRVSATAGSRRRPATAASIFSSWPRRPRARAAGLRRARGRRRQRDARSGVPERLRGLRGRDRSRHRRGRASPATPRSTTSAAASIR